METTIKFKEFEKSLRKSIPFSFLIGNMLILLLNDLDSFLIVNISIILGYLIWYIPGLFVEFLFFLKRNKK